MKHVLAWPASRTGKRTFWDEKDMLLQVYVIPRDIYGTFIKRIDDLIIKLQHITQILTLLDISHVTVLF